MMGFPENTRWTTHAAAVSAEEYEARQAELQRLDEEKLAAERAARKDPVLVTPWEALTARLDVLDARLSQIEEVIAGWPPPST